MMDKVQIFLSPIGEEEIQEIENLVDECNALGQVNVGMEPVEGGFLIEICPAEGMDVPIQFWAEDFHRIQIAEIERDLRAKERLEEVVK